MTYYKIDFDEDYTDLPPARRLNLPKITKQELKYKLRDLFRELGEESCEHCIDLFIRLLVANETKQIVVEMTGTLRATIDDI